jgi:heme A synthase
MWVFAVAGLICAVGVAVPFSRVPRISWMAHVVDAAIVVAFCAVAYVRTRSRP